ncbi:MAG: glycogen synthase GlgA [Oscillospiraceae bacterium]|nr:glycogen synthase GlgA [Oscillospiraceae bacterium]MDY2848315.1 glycogen synthase GlgA [Oscillospiraceae bacterium]
MKNILFAASECVPFIKTGGLADVVGTLPKMFNKEEFDVRVIIPNYTCIPDKYRNNFRYVTHFYMELGHRFDSVHVGIMEYELDGIKFYFVDNEFYFGGAKPYADTRYDIEKFTFFSKAVLAILPVINFRPDVIHCHDWQAALIPVFMKTIYGSNSFYSNTKTIMTIHNLRFQGIWDVDTFKYLTGLPDYMFTPDKLEYKKDANMLKGGIVYSDYITTVSNTYAGEIQSWEYGEGLDGLLRARNRTLCGIVNGIDYEAYNPSKDKDIAKTYNSKTFHKAKETNKLALQEELGLEKNESRFVISIISRLTDQKGLDLVKYVLDQICDEFTQFVIVGTGDEQYENLFKHYQWKYKGRVSANIFFSESLAHRVYASSDAVLVPSRFEPCGLTQLIGMRYGTLPIVRETGGLKDTVSPYNEYENTGTGFSFANYNAGELINTINYAKKIYFDDRKAWDDMVRRAMTADYSWNTSAKKYEELYYRITSWN